MVHLQRGICCALWAWVEVCVHSVSFMSKGRVTGWFFFCLSSAPWLRLFELNFFLVVNLFTFFAAFFNGLHTLLHVCGQCGLNRGRYGASVACIPLTHPVP